MVPVALEVELRLPIGRQQQTGFAEVDFGVGLVANPAQARLQLGGLRNGRRLVRPGHEPPPSRGFTAR